MIPDLSLEEIERFLKKERVTVWMKDMSEVLKNYVAAVPNPCRPTDVGGRQGQQLSLGDALAYRVRKVLNVAHSAHVKRYSHGEKSGPKGASETFEQAMAAGGDAWRYKSVQFTRKDGVAYWLSKAGDWIPVDASPSEDCRRCAAAEKWKTCAIGVSGAHFGHERTTSGGTGTPSREYQRQEKRDRRSGGW